MTKFHVKDNGKSADCEHFPVSSSWNNATHDTMESAAEYAHKWLGQYSPGQRFLIQNKGIKDYSGYGDNLEILEIQ